MDRTEEQKILKAYIKLNSIIEDLNSLEVWPSLVWLWTWDVVRNKLDDYTPDMQEDYILNPELTELDIFKLFYTQAETNGFTLEYGLEALDDQIYNWLHKSVLVEYTEEDEE